MNEILLVNPRKRRKGGKRRAKSSHRRRGHVRLKRHASRRRRVHRVKARRFKRNPSFSLKSVGSSFLPVVKSGALGAVGAIANGALVAQVANLSFVPDALKSGYGRKALELGSAVVVGTLGNMVLKGKGNALAVGAATVAMHGLLKDVISTNLPSVAPFLGDMGGYNPGQLVDESGMGAYVPGVVGDYDDDSGVGAYVPGMVGGGDDDM